MLEPLRAFPLLLALVAFAPSSATASDGGSQGAPIRIPEWRMIGPFPVGVREGMVHPLADWSGRVPGEFTWQELFPSAIANGGQVPWTTLPGERDEKGDLTARVTLRFENVDWETREREWGAAAALNTALLHGTFTLERPATLVMEASRCNATINGVPYPGDPYAAGISRSVLRGKAGLNTVWVESSGMETERFFTFQLVPVPGDSPDLRVLENDLLLPDRVEGVGGEGWAGIPLLNLTYQWQGGIEVTVEGAMRGSARLDLPLAPFAPVKVPVRVQWDADSPDTEVMLRARTGRGEATGTTKVRIRKPDESRAETFLSRMDGSAQKYGIRFPTAYDPAKKYALILALHGAGVDAAGLPDSFAPKDWAFVVAPTNRRPYGFDWQDWGRLDALEVLDHVLARYPIDPERVSVVGHSMGGHGAWVLCVHHADRFASCTPSAGWIGIDTYVPLTLRRSQNFAPPELAGMYLRGIASGRVSTFLENLRNLPVRIVHGGADDNVPPTHARMLWGALRQMGVGAMLHEVPGMGHWWDKDADRPGADCMDPRYVEPIWKGTWLDRWPKHVVLVSVDPDVDPAMYWVHLLGQQKTAEESRIEAVVTSPSSFRVTTRNVSSMALELSSKLLEPGKIAIEWNGRTLALQLPPGGGTYVFEEGRIRRKTKPLPAPGVNDHPGSLQKALFEPFLLVTGTKASPDRSAILLDLARSLATAWWVRGNGTVAIVRDTDVTDALRGNYNLVLLGGPEENAETARIERNLLIRAGAQGVTLAGRSVPGSDLAAVHWQRDPRFPGRKLLVYQATTVEGDLLLRLLGPFASNLGYPDYVVFGPEVRARGSGGFKAAGWWTSAFRYDPGNGWRDRD